MRYGVAFLHERAGQMLGDEDLHKSALVFCTGLCLEL